MGRKIIVTRKEHFNAAHKLYNPNWSKERNEQVFGACANEYYHGHNFDLEVSVKGEIDEDTGFVIDLKVLSTLIKELVVNQLDHKNINIEVPFMKDKMASCENLIVEIWNLLAPAVKENSSAELYSLILHETKNNVVEYYGE